MAAELLKYIPTGYPVIDILLGQNVRDLDGNLTDIVRGATVGQQMGICANPGFGKTTLAMDIAVAGRHYGYPIHRLLFIDSDCNPINENRVNKLTNMSEDERKGWFEIRNITMLEEVTDLMTEVDKEYKSHKFKPVEVVDIITQKKRKMMPYVVLVFDTITSMKSNKFSFGGDSKADPTANIQGMTEGRLKGDICNSITNICDGNIVVYWLAHLKKNTPAMGQQQAKKSYKSAPHDITDHLPERFRQRLSFIFWIPRVYDATNQESSTHPKYIYGFKDEGSQIYIADFTAVKSRASAENRVKIRLVFENGKFNNMTSLLDTLYNIPDGNGIGKAGGQYPSPEFPSVFTSKEDKEEYKVSKRDALKITDSPYTRPFNLIEARLLLGYCGEDMEVHAAKRELTIALLQKLEDIFKPGLECNNVTKEEIARNKNAFTSIYGFIGEIKRDHKISSDELKRLADIAKSAPIEIEVDDVA